MTVKCCINNRCSLTSTSIRVQVPMTTAKDLSKEAPRSPRTRLGGYILMARMIDKGRAVLNATAGEYHFACRMDQWLFTYKGVAADDVKADDPEKRDNPERLEWFNRECALLGLDPVKTTLFDYLETDDRFSFKK